MKKLITLIWLMALVMSLIVPPAIQAQTNCPAPTGLNAGSATTSSIQLSWTAPAGVMFFYLQYRPAGSTNWVQVTSQLPSYTLNNLTCGAVYEWRVQSVCANSGSTALSAFSPVGVFTILPCSTTCPTPAGLTTTNIGINQATVSWLTLPGATTYNIRYKPASALNWTVINNASTPYQLSGLGCNHNYVWQVQAVCPSTTGAASVSPWSASASFTTLACPGSCPAPTGLASTNITASSANVSWNAVAGAGSYTVRYRPGGSLAWIYTNTTATSKNLFNLVCNMQYQWQVRANCAPVSNSTINVFSQTANFTTLACPSNCVAPTTLSVANITSTSAVLSWNNTGVNNYRVQYAVAGTINYTQVLVTGTSTTITGLLPATPYVWQVQSVCATGSAPVFSPWSPLNTFLTSSVNNLCAIPTGLTASVVSPQSALLSWNAVAGALSYNVRYKMLNSTNTNWINTTSTTNSKQITGLSVGMVYEFQVQTVCGTSNGALITSAWSPSNMFTARFALTLIPNPASDVVNVAFDSETTSITTIEIRDLFGNIAYTSTLQSSAGENILTIDTGTLKEGLYNLRLLSGNEVNSSRLLIQR